MAYACRKGLVPSRTLRIGLACLLSFNELFRYFHDGMHFPNELPLHLCTIATWVTVIACLTLAPLAVEFAYFPGLLGASLALINPDLPPRVQANFFSYECLRYIIEHGTLVIAISVLVFGGLARLRRTSLWWGNATFVVFGFSLLAFNAAFGTNYLYLYRKPLNPSLLDLFGPWPVYLMVSEVFAFTVFSLMWLPVRHLAKEVIPSEESR